MTSLELEARLAPFSIDRDKYPIIIAGFRGYYLSMGKKGQNDHGVFDDAIMLHSLNVYMACNGNVDPTAQPGAVTGRAKLTSGFWPMWKLDKHRGKYLAFCQRAAECVVYRDNTEDFMAGTIHSKYGRCLGKGLWKGYFGINGHMASETYTSSEGCQTVPKSQWDALIAVGIAEAKRFWGAKWQQGVIPYVLFDA